MAKLQRLRCVQRRQVRRGYIGLVGAIAEDLQEGQERGVVGRGREGLDLWAAEQFGEYVGVWCGGCALDKIGCCAGGGGGFGEGEEGLSVGVSWMMIDGVGGAEGMYL